VGRERHGSDQAFKHLTSVSRVFVVTVGHVHVRAAAIGVDVLGQCGSLGSCAFGFMGPEDVVAPCTQATVMVERAVRACLVNVPVWISPQARNGLADPDSPELIVGPDKGGYPWGQYSTVAYIFDIRQDFRQ
jgi:hypothetical protein